MHYYKLLIALFITVIFGLNGCSDTVSNKSGGHADDSNTLYRGNGGEPGTLNPTLAEDKHAFDVLADLFEGLVAEAADGELIPGVAESWSISDDGRVYTFTLRANAKWSDGTPVVAQDFVRTFRRVAAPESQSSYAFLHEPVENFAAVHNGTQTIDQLGITALDNDTLEIRLTNRTAHWLSILALPISAPTKAANNFEEIGNAAYKIASRSPGGPIRLDRNLHYWDASNVKIANVVWLPVADAATEFNMYRAGEIDITHNVPTEQFARAKDLLPEQLRVSPALALYYLAFDLSEPPFDNLILRQALSLAIDRKTVVSLLNRGELPAFGVVPPGVYGYRNVSYSWQNDAKNVREKLAQELYASAGYSQDNPLSIKFVYDTEDPHERIALATASMWKDVLGVDVSLDKREWNYFLDTRAKREEWDVMRFAWFGDYNGPRTFLDIFLSANEQNLPQFENSKYDNLIRAASQSGDAEEASALLSSAETELIEAYPIVPIYYFVNKHLVKPHVGGFVNTVTDRHPSRFLSINVP